jgi:uncharacterized secreted protein with C-terminal beta-propeller domain
MIFHDMSTQMKPPKQLVERVLQEAGVTDTGVELDLPLASRSNRRWWFALAAAFVVVVVGASTALWLPNQLGQSKSLPSANKTVTTSNGALSGAVVAADSYDELYQMISLQVEKQKEAYLSYSNIPDDSLMEIPAAEAPQVEAAGAPPKLGLAGKSDDAARVSSVNDSPDYSGTNTQVANIDEGDIVKTDGSSIFVAKELTVAVLNAAGADTQQIASINVADGLNRMSGIKSGNSWVREMLLFDTTLVVIANVDISDTAETLNNFVYDYGYYGTIGTQETVALLYDISDPEKPRLKTPFRQSGGYTTSRLSDGVLYLISEYWLDDLENVKKGEPSTFVPLVGCGNISAKPIPAAHITVMPDFASTNSTRYAVVTSVSLEHLRQLGQQAVLGGSDTVYMSEHNLFFAGTTWVENYKMPDQLAKQFDVSGLVNASTTHLVRLALNDGAIAVAADTTIPGMPVNQFALDEYNGYLRIAVTIDALAKSRMANINITDAALFVLDGDLQVVGSIARLAKNESVQSVRFSGPVGYVVTFRQTDPLFAIDLSTPQAPKVMSKLKIPGFSTYLHPWGNDKLFGLGWDGNESGTTGNLKLAMFDVSDPFDVSEISSQPLEYYEAEATYDHHAILADPERNLIGFSTTDWYEQKYLIFSYDTKRGFIEKQSYNLSDWQQENYYDYDSYSIRAIRIGEVLYLVSTSYLMVISLESWNVLCYITVNN